MSRLMQFVEKIFEKLCLSGLAEHYVSGNLTSSFYLVQVVAKNLFFTEILTPDEKFYRLIFESKWKFVLTLKKYPQASVDKTRAQCIKT